MKLTAKDYIEWVQRSLNRLLGVEIVTNGAITVPYRDAIEEFQFAYGLPRTRDVASRDQDEIIKANHKTPEYVRWVQEVLVKVGAGMGLAPSGIWNKDTKIATQSFQAYIGLRDDGWVGAKTETALIRESRVTPPGHIRPGVPLPPSPTRPPAPPVPIDPLPIEKRVDRVIGAIFWEIVHNPSMYPNTQQRKQLKCLLGKLKRGGLDDKYIPKHRARSFVLGTDWAYPKYMPDDLANSAREILKLRVKKLSLADRTKKSVIRKLVMYLYYEIELGLTEITNMYTLHGGLPSLTHPHRQDAAKVLHRWAYDRQHGKTGLTSILACFK